MLVNRATCNVVDIRMGTIASAAPQEVKGIIVTNQNGLLTVKTKNGQSGHPNRARRQIQSVSGPLGGQKQTVPVSSLIPGLPISVDGDDFTGQLVASRIEYKSSDYKTAAQIQAGVEATADKEAQLRKAYSQLGEFNVRNELAVYFKSGSSTISAGDRKSLASLSNRRKACRATSSRFWATRIRRATQRRTSGLATLALRT